MTKPECRFDGCHLPSWVRGWCRGHYKQWLDRGRDDARLTVFRTRVKPTAAPRDCEVDGCGRPGRHVDKRLCKSHYAQLVARDRDWSRLTPLQPTSAPGIREPRAAKPKPKKETSNLPDGWFTPTRNAQKKRPKAAIPANPSDVMLYYTPPTPEQTAGALRTLAAHDALDLADMLGIAS